MNLLHEINELCIRRLNLLVAIAVVAIGAIAFSGCDPVAAEEDQTILTETKVDLANLIRTVKHDDHLFVLATRHEGISIIHHPSCPLEKPKE